MSNLNADSLPESDAIFDLVAAAFGSGQRHAASGFCLASTSRAFELEVPFHGRPAGIQIFFFQRIVREIRIALDDVVAVRDNFVMSDRLGYQLPRNSRNRIALKTKPRRKDSAQMATRYQSTARRSGNRCARPFARLPADCTYASSPTRSSRLRAYRNESRLCEW
jgi:hypothetical protein